MESEFILKDGRTLHLSRPRAADAAEMLEFVKIIGGETDFLLIGAQGLPYTIEREAEVLEGFYKEPRGGFFIGRIDGEIACSFNLACTARLRIAHVAQIALAVQRKFWGIGVGGIIMQTLIALAREQGVRMIELGVYAENTRAQALYKRFGFEEVGRHKGRLFVNGTSHDEIMMDLYL